MKRQVSRFRNMATTTFVCLGLIGISACGKKDSGNDSDPFSGKKGSVQGFIIDGVTRQPVTIPDYDGTQGVRILAHNYFIKGKATASNYNFDDKSKSLTGEYHINNVPLDETFPLLVDIPGYQKFQGYVHITSTIKPKAERAKEDIVRNNPTEIANIFVFPKGYQAEDLSFRITSDALPVQNAQVQLRYTGSNALLNNNNLESESLPFFLSPINTRTGALTATSDGKGLVKFSKDQLVLGGQYLYSIIPPSGGLDEGIETGRVVIGLASGLGLKQTPYVVDVELKNVDQALKVVSNSLSSAEPQADGKLTVIFNRDIELVPASKNNITASLRNPIWAQLAENNPTMPDSEMVSVEINGRTLTLTPKWAQGRQPDLKFETALSVIYSGVLVRPSTGTGRNGGVLLDSLLGGMIPQVFFVGAKDNHPALTTIDISNYQNVATEGEYLSGMITITTLNQFREPMPSKEIVLKVVSGHGAIKLNGSNEEKQQVSAHSDHMGAVKFSWKLGTPGEQKIKISVPEMPHGEHSASTFELKATALTKPANDDNGNDDTGNDDTGNDDSSNDDSDDGNGNDDTDNGDNGNDDTGNDGSTDSDNPTE